MEQVWNLMGRTILNLQKRPQTLTGLQHELEVARNDIPQENNDHVINYLISKFSKLEFSCQII